MADKADRSAPRVVIAGSTLPNVTFVASFSARITRCVASLQALTEQNLASGSVVVLTSEFIEEAGGQTIWEFMRLHEVRILVVVTNFLDRGVRYLLSGSRGVIRPDISSSDFQKAIEKVMAGEIWATRRLLSEALRECIARTGRPILTPREQEVFKLACAGYSNQRIADTLFVSRDTVRWHMRSIYGKLGRTAVKRKPLRHTV